MLKEKLAERELLNLIGVVELKGTIEGLREFSDPNRNINHSIPNIESFEGLKNDLSSANSHKILSDLQEFRKFIHPIVNKNYSIVKLISKITLLIRRKRKVNV